MMKTGQMCFDFDVNLKFVYAWTYMY